MTYLNALPGTRALLDDIGALERAREVLRRLGLLDAAGERAFAAGLRVLRRQLDRQERQVEK